MSDGRALVAIDLGAESCRVSLLRSTSEGLRATLVYRFPNGARETPGGLRWPLAAMESQLAEGLRRCAQLAPEGIRSIGIDGWAVDYVRLDESGHPLGEPLCYRDPRTVEAEAWVHARMDPARLRAATGVQLQRINTLYQLVADQLHGHPAARWLNLPEYLLYRLGGRPVGEWTNASHTQLAEPGGEAWLDDLFAALGLERSAAPELVPPGTVVGKLRGPLAELPAFGETLLIAPACHDTASAVAGIAGPEDGCDWAYISSGTWSLVGSLQRRPVLSEKAAQANFTNLAAPGGRVLFHKGVNGLWLLRQCMDAWGTVELESLLAAATALPAPPVLLDVSEPELSLPGQMPWKITQQIAGAGGPALDESHHGAPALASLIFHSLADTYARILREAEEITGCRYRMVCTIGGGSRNTLLHSLLEQASGLRVQRGHGESSTLGNFAVQLAALESGTVDAPTISGWARQLAEGYVSAALG